ncbi:glycosyltransferase [Amycolatopsis thermophila]|uniref:GT2 family glycosyltransferase/2-polyprenyl-3-methyl-5-hydroxy-6-metoxy-1,4-benzoquinol methylase/glycosyltransferase involved in cell wall biosynthesis n=1 Tax=Amycolatopsis thermophila TaxID=206084 RepID=A0ABU0EP28_9PSEU|nr:glycosyltransferase [Amycolatopsis thermophila]MDQ0377051.1 GT2 family glycosyltransferase/2-polyprenyl-3-methyl-5-hydroxy-6-metoxy-1,4-benzoquinol methylase/glycosyltransferase involved in cell wall biosynthesis [Amycolatopsis thermophila]
MAGSRGIDWTGERCVPWADDIQVIYEHYHRYALAARYTFGRRVLDLASGEGYGSALLAAHAAEVVGVDIDEASVAHARARYGDRPNLRFTTGSMTDPALLADAGKFDVITCFEALEHVAEQDELMRLVRARLAPGGIFFTSTPDVLVYTHEHGNDNPFHVKELTEPQFRALLGASFEHVTVLRQNVAVGSVLTGDREHGPVLAQQLRRTGEDAWSVGTGAPHTYLVGVASDNPVEVPVAATLLDPQLTLLGQAAERAAAPLRAEIDRLTAEHGPRPRRLIERVRPRRRPADGPVAVTTSDDPLVTIVIPVHGQWSYTRRCLQSLEESGARVPFEVVVVDDASPDDSAEQLAACPGVRLVRTHANLGFLGAVNLGASHARGEFLVLLNNDTEVRPGWLDALTGVVRAEESIGLAGAKLVYPDGRLQECGGIVFADGSAANYGHGGDPDDPRYQAVRDVDYCSGAAILVRRELWERLGGFDERYSPAYYEDTDLAFAVRDAGYRTVVVPDAVVVHHEGVSHGTDVTAGVKRYQEINHEVFAAKWAAALAEQADPGTSLWIARQRVPGRAQRDGDLVLVADVTVPTPDRDSGSVRLSSLLDELVALGHRVVFCPMGPPSDPSYLDRLHRAGITVLVDPGLREQFLHEAGAHLSLALLSRPTVAWHLADRLRICAPRARIVFDTVDLHFVRLSREAELVERLGGAPETSAMLHQRSRLYRELELALVRACDRTLVVSEAERDLLADLAPGAPVQVLSNVHIPGPPASPAGRPGVLFVGSFEHPPNRDAAYWLAGEIWPLVRRRLPEAVLDLVGHDPTDELRALDGHGVRFRGWVADLAALYDTARLSVAPLRFGAGVKGKVGESLAAGVPVVGTTLAFEGMRLRDGEEVLVGDKAEEIADGIVSLLTDDALWLRLSRAGQAAVAAQFGPDVARAALTELLA